MPDVKVMVVDDSAAMRALFCDILDNAKGVAVCGVASDASEARDKIPECKPDVLTLDVEMPGMSGMEFLEELMGSDNPLPVIMLSSIAQAGSGTAQKAMELGAVHCFPKPLHSSREEFDATVKKLGDIVVRAAAGELDEDSSDESADEEAPGAPYEPDGSVVVLACGAAGLDAASAIASSYPANGPATVLVVDGAADAIEAALPSGGTDYACTLAKAEDNVELTPGTVLIAADPARHAIVEAGSPPRLRLVGRDPVAGARPSADLLLGSMARAKVKCVAGVLAGSGSDGAKGLQIIAKAGGKTFVQGTGEGASDRQSAVTALDIGSSELEPAALGPWIIENTSAG